MAEGNVALIAGVTGLTGVNMARYLLGPKPSSTWSRVYGVSRSHSDALPKGLRHLSCDLLNKEDALTRLGELDDVTHVYYCAVWYNFAEQGQNTSKYISENTAMLENLLTSLRRCPLVHVVLLTGTKHYLGQGFKGLAEGPTNFVPIPVPYKEDVSRDLLPKPNFYFDLEDVLLRESEERKFTWTVSRPVIVVGAGLPRSNQINIFVSAAVYAAICKYIKKPLIFPGSKAAYEAFFCLVDTDVLCEHMEWEATSRNADNLGYNVANGDVVSYRTIWPHLAAFFDLEYREPKVTFSVATFVADHSDIWNEMVEKYGLQPYPLEEILKGWLLDIMFNIDVSWMVDLMRSRERGFLRYQSSDKSLTKLLNFLQKDRIIP